MNDENLYEIDIINEVWDTQFELYMLLNLIKLALKIYMKLMLLMTFEIVKIEINVYMICDMSK